ncbi:pyrimidine utilization protein D [Neorhizobium sp. JUb45]|uniref:pyrimidine utilization protein D n=1 Tax=unclassified Neorhizobium TaxID=2629175 RepID=UPI00104DED56|nr:pyrimidine utilization protein D [Neorhizobium sp. JUb45]TCR02987.1 aminoacrylate hydrolase [Neorhizobium sp. JUb45]
MLHFDVHGVMDASAPTIILSSGLGGSASYWAPQIEALKARFRVVTYDHFGTGRSPGEVPEGYAISDMADEVMEIAAALGLTSFSFMGHAFGGLVGLDLALRFPEVIDRLVLVNAWAKADPHSGRCFDVRIELLEKSGVPAFVKAQPLFLYPAIWMAENSSRMAEEEKHALLHFQGKENILHRIAALRAFDIEGRLEGVNAPTLVVATKDDMLVPYSRSLQLADALPDSTLALFDFGAHAVNVVDPQGFNDAVLSFLNDR